MAILGGTRRLVAAARALRRRSAPDAAPAPAGAPRPVRPRPGEREAVSARLARWSDPSSPAAVPAAMSGADRAAAMAQLADLRGRLEGEQAALIDAALADGAVAVRRLGPADGHLWEMPGMRVFAIAGVQAFTVRDEDPPAGGPP